MPKGAKKVRDFIKTNDTLRSEEIDTLSTVDKGYDFVKPGETAQIGRVGK